MGVGAGRRGLSGLKTDFTNQQEQSESKKGGELVFPLKLPPRCPTCLCWRPICLAYSRTLACLNAELDLVYPLPPQCLPFSTALC